jgi:glycerol kinase
MHRRCRAGDRAGKEQQVSRRCILAIDQGTTNSKAVLVDEAGSIIARGSCPLRISYPQPGWVEQDPAEIWDTVQRAVSECLAAAADVELVTLAITNQRESVTIWERRTGRPVGPCVLWQCQRGAPRCAELRAQGLEPRLRAQTGLTIDPMFSASKARWLLEHVADGAARAARGALCLGTIDSWVLWNLTGGAVHACDFTNASRTQLMDLGELAWSGALLDLFGVPAAALPEIRPSGALYGVTAPGLAHLPAGLPIASMIGDSHAALYGHAGFGPGSVKATYGTGSSLMTPIRQPIISGRGLSTTIAWARDRVTYALEGNVYATGAAVQWLGELLGLDDAGLAIERLAKAVPDTDGVYFVPAFVGLGAPHWNSAARGLIAGITRGTSGSHMARAALEAIAYQVRDVFDVMAAESDSPLKTLFADGGASRNDRLMQFQADMLGVPVMRSASPELSALGAAYLAGLTVGIWKSEEEIAALPRAADRFEPQMPEAQRQALYAGWQRAVARAEFDPGMG